MELENAERVQSVLIDIYDFFCGVLAERRDASQDDLLSALTCAEEDGSFLSEDDLLATCTTLIQARHETTANLISNGLLILLNHPDQLELLREPDADGISNRRDSPLHRFGGQHGSAVIVRCLTDGVRW